MNEQAIARIRRAILARGGKITNDRGDKFRATTICHEGGDGQNLSAQQAGEKCLVFCHSRQCSPLQIVHALGLEMRDLYDDQHPNRDYPRYRPDKSVAWTATRHLNGKNGKAFTNTRGQASEEDKRILYNANEAREAIAAGRPVYVVEGEKDADTVTALGQVAVTSGGAGTANSADWSPLFGSNSRVIIIPDRDSPGEGYAKQVIEHLTGNVHTIELKAVRQANGINDLTDHIAAGETLDTLALVKTIHSRTVRSLQASEIEPEEARWLWAGCIPQGSLTVLAGIGGVGKSTLAAYLAARVSRGELGGDDYGSPQAVLFWEAEDSPAQVTVPRLIAAGADLKCVHIVDGAHVGDGREPLQFPQDIAPLEHKIRETGASLVVLSPILSAVSGDLAKVETIRKAFNPLNALAERCGVTILGIAHLRKGAGAGSDLISGSHAIRDCARAALILAKDDDGTRLLEVEKCNYSSDASRTYEFTLEEVKVPVKRGKAAIVARVAGLTASDRSAVDAASTGGVSPEEREARNECQQWLVDYLLSQPGYEAPRRDVLAEARKEGYSPSDMDNARRRCKSPRVVAERVRAPKAPSVWKIIEDNFDIEPGGDATPQGGSRVSHVTRVTRVTRVTGSEGDASERDPLPPRVHPSDMADNAARGTSSIGIAEAKKQAGPAKIGQQESRLATPNSIGKVGHQGVLIDTGSTPNESRQPRHPNPGDVSDASDVTAPACGRRADFSHVTHNESDATKLHDHTPSAGEMFDTNRGDNHRPGDPGEAGRMFEKWPPRGAELSAQNETPSPLHPVIANALAAAGVTPGLFPEGATR